MKAVLILWLMSFAFEPLMAQTDSGPEKRLALVIGNADYKIVSALPTALNDAADMATTLKQLGFDVMLYTNTDKLATQQAISEFSTRLKGHQVGLFYYSGHGLAAGGEQFLIPIDADSAKLIDPSKSCLSLSALTTDMASAKAATNVVVLNADRNNPSKYGALRRDEMTSSLPSSVMASGFLIAYSTSPGRSLISNTGRNGFYTSALLSNLKTPGLTIEEVFSRTRRVVSQQTGMRQLPWETSSLTQDFYFLRHN
jgi:uncharacterized caspase-like protein